MTVFMLLILHKNIITKLCILTAVTTGTAIRTAVRYICDVKHFAVRATRTVFQSPPVILCRQIIYIFLFEAGCDSALCTFFITWCIFVACKYSCCQMISVKTVYLCQQFKTPFGTLFLEVITKAPASHHFKESHMACIANGINIICTDTTLYITESCTERMLLTEQIRHQRLHTCHVEHNTC